MTREEKKELVWRAWSALIEGDTKTAFAHMADEVSWFIPGRFPGVSTGLHKGKQAILDHMAGGGGPAQLFPGGLKAKEYRVFADGSTVVVEVTYHATGANGRSYENDYCFVFELEGNRIRRVREYFDTQKAGEILFS